MNRQLRFLFACALIIGLAAGCSLFPAVKDETAGWGADRLYQEAHDAVVEGNYTRALKLFEQLESRFPYGRYSQQAILEEAYANYKTSETAAAIADCDRFIKLYPNHAYVDYAYYLKGLANFNGDTGLFGSLVSQALSDRDPKATREAYDTFKTLALKFPNSKYTSDAKARAEFLLDALAEHEAHVANYYFRRGAYVAALNRAQYIIVTYPNANATEDALVVMAESYERLDLPVLRDDTKRVLEKTFPNDSKLLEPHHAWWKFWQS